MTIIAILLAFALCHFVRELGRFRQNQWLASWINFANGAFGKFPGWQDVLGFLILIALPALLLLMINQLLYSAFGSTGAFLLAIIVLIYTYGPKDLDTEVAAIIESEEGEPRQEALAELLGGPVPEDHDACRALAVESVFREALRRWFSIIFWFAVLGIVGAFLYRLVDWMVQEDYPLSDDQKDLFIRLRQILD